MTSVVGPVAWFRHVASRRLPGKVNDMPRKLTIEAASEYTGYGERIIREAVKRGDLPRAPVWVRAWPALLRSCRAGPLARRHRRQGRHQVSPELAAALQQLDKSVRAVKAQPPKRRRKRDLRALARFTAEARVFLLERRSAR